MILVKITPQILAKIISLRQNLTETLYFLVVNPIFWIAYT
jgi:hypothetical protein